MLLYNRYIPQRSRTGQPNYLIPVLPPALRDHFTLSVDEKTLMAQAL